MELCPKGTEDYVRTAMPHQSVGHSDDALKADVKTRSWKSRRVVKLTASVPLVAASAKRIFISTRMNATTPAIKLFSVVPTPDM